MDDVAPVTNGGSRPLQPTPESLQARRTAAIICLIAALPPTFFYLASTKWLVAIGQLIVAALIARAWYLGKTKWNTLFLLVGVVSILFGVSTVIRDWPDLRQIFSTLSGIGFVASLALLLQGRATPRRRLIAIFLYVLLGFPMAVAWLVTRLH